MRVELQTFKKGNDMVKLAELEEVSFQLRFENNKHCGTTMQLTKSGIDEFGARRIIRDLVFSLMIIEAIKKDPSLTEVDTREVWRVAAPMVMDILGAVWGE